VGELNQTAVTRLESCEDLGSLAEVSGILVLKAGS